MSFESEDSQYTVVKNHEEQYSIWAKEKEVPGGWATTGFSGSKEACLDHINEVWTDMRPASLRRKMDVGSAGPGSAS